MTRIVKPFRGKLPSKRFDPSDLRYLMRDPRTWCSIGIVADPGDGPHFESDNGDFKDVLVEVVLQPSLTAVTARLAATVWVVPNIGDEVVVLLPEGDPAFMPVIVAMLSSNDVPTTQGPALDRIAIVRGEVVVHDGAGGAVALALKSDVTALRDHYATHTHGGVTTGGGASAVPVQAGSAPNAVGTTVLKGK